jgi:hypothetical protein
MKTSRFRWLLATILLGGMTASYGNIRFDPPDVIAVGDAPVRLSARGGSGIRFTSSNSRIARISGSRIRAVNPGSVRVTATAANGRRATRSIAIGSRPQLQGSRLANAPNLLIGPEQAPIRDPISGAPILTPSFQTSCTFRSLGIVGNVTQLGSVVPGSGIIRSVSVRCGPNPSPMQVVIMSGSAGLYGTALRTSRPFTPLANAITTVRVDLPVTRSFQPGTNISDAVGLNILGPGTAPLFDQANGGSISANGSGLLQHWYPIMRPGEPENGRAYLVGGIELLMAWEYIQLGNGVQR